MRMAAQEKLRRENEFRAEHTSFSVTGDKLFAVRHEITDGRIELKQADFQWRKANK
jgi:hypothetical protein